MSQTIKRKKIIIESQGPIFPKGGAYGPMLTPYYEDIQTIQALVVGGYSVKEITESGKQVKLTLVNVNADNDFDPAEEAKKKEEAAKAAKEAKRAEEEAAKEAKRAEEAAARAKAEEAKRNAKNNAQVEEKHEKK